MQKLAGKKPKPNLFTFYHAIKIKLTPNTFGDYLFHSFSSLCYKHVSFSQTGDQ